MAYSWRVEQRNSYRISPKIFLKVLTLNTDKKISASHWCLAALHLNSNNEFYLLHNDKIKAQSQALGVYIILTSEAIFIE
jgi:hypothetical protein